MNNSFIPVYSSTTSVSVPYTAPSRGIFLATLESTWSSSANAGIVYVDGVSTASNSHTGGTSGKIHTNIIPTLVAKRQKITISSAGSNCRFTPLK